jgi:hypothetical protein
VRAGPGGGVLIMGAVCGCIGPYTRLLHETFALYLQVHFTGPSPTDTQ